VRCPFSRQQTRVWWRKKKSSKLRGRLSARRTSWTTFWRHRTRGFSSPATSRQRTATTDPPSTRSILLEVKRLKVFFVALYRSAGEHHLPYRITRRYLLADAGKRRYLLDLFTPEGWKAELTLVLVIYRDSLPAYRQSCTNPSSNHLIAIRRGVETTAFWSLVYCSDHYASEPSATLFTSLLAILDVFTLEKKAFSLISSAKKVMCLTFIYLCNIYLSVGLITGLHETRTDLAEIFTEGWSFLVHLRGD